MRDIWGMDVMSEITEHKELIEREAAIAALEDIDVRVSMCMSVDEARGMLRMKEMAIKALSEVEETPPRVVAEIRFTEEELEKIKQSVLDEFREYFNDEMC